MRKSAAVAIYGHTPLATRALDEDKKEDMTDSERPVSIITRPTNSSIDVREEAQAPPVGRSLGISCLSRGVIEGERETG